MEMRDKNGNYFISKEDLEKLHEGLRILAPLKTKYYKLGKTITSSSIPEGLKSHFFSLGREIERILNLWSTFGEAK